MRDKKNWISGLILVGLMIVTFYVLLRDQPLTKLSEIIGQLKLGWLVAGLGLMFLFELCEASCTRQILSRLGNRTKLRRCLGYSFVGFYFSSITPSATGGQPAQIYCMTKDGVSAAHGTLNMMLLALCYQVVLLGYSLVSALLRPGLLDAMGAGFRILLLYGAAVNVALTAVVLCFMFLPNAARKLASWVLNLLVRLRIIKDRVHAEEKLEYQLAEYRRGAECLKHNPGLIPVLLGLTVLQWTALFAVPFAAYKAFGLTGYGPAELICTQALVTLAVASLPLPGAMGASEGGFVKAMALFFGSNLVTPAVLVSRGISFYSFLLISGGVTLAVHMCHSRARPSQPSPAADPNPPKGTPDTKHPHHRNQCTPLSLQVPPLRGAGGTSRPVNQ